MIALILICISLLPLSLSYTHTQAELSGGVYIKAAQHIANLGHGIPAEYSQILSAMQDKAPPVHFDKIKALLEEEYGVDISQVFRQITPTPIAAASLAQVHDAVTLDGEKVAVKVQYGFLRDVAEMDISTVKTCIDLVKVSGHHPISQ